MLLDTWQNAENEVQPRRRTSKAAADFEVLPKEFTVEKATDTLGIDKQTAVKRITRWLNAGYVKNLTPEKKPARYEKVVTHIMV